MDRARLRSDLIRDEGREKAGVVPGRFVAYQDSKGIWTAGVGRNLQTRGFSADEVDLLLENDIDEHLALLDKYLPWWSTLDEVRQLVLANMAFNLGVGPSAEDPNGKLLKFETTLDLVRTGNYTGAADHMKALPWALQVGARARRLIEMMRSGELLITGEPK